MRYERLRDLKDTRQESRTVAERTARCGVNMYRILQRHRAVPLPQYGFLVRPTLAMVQILNFYTQYADFQGRDAKSRR